MMERIVDIPDDIQHVKSSVFGMKYITGLPVREEIIRCRDCKGAEVGPWHRCETFLTHGENPNGFCAWAERRDQDQELSPGAQKIYEQLIAGLERDA